VIPFSIFEEDLIVELKEDIIPFGFTVFNLAKSGEKD
jgi:hypothetical protein